jgi:maltose O-acetyltransferase
MTNQDLPHTDGLSYHRVVTTRTKAHKYLSLLSTSAHVKFALVNVLCGLLPAFFSGVVRGRLYRLTGLAVDRGVFIMGNLKLTSALPGFYHKLSIGEGTVISTDVTINLDDRVTIEENVCIGPYVLIYTGGHRVGGPDCRMGEVTARPVTVERGAWIRLGAIILPGITVGHGSIVAAGAVVFDDVPPNTYVQGNPSRVKYELH